MASSRKYTPFATRDTHLIDVHRPLKRDSESGGDVDHINRRLASYKRRLTWQNSPYLLTECYLYRRVQTIFDRSKYWRGFDVFQRQKELALSSSRYAIEELASLYMTGNIELGPLEPTNAAQKTLFTTMTQIALWGDAVEIPSVENIKQGAVQPLAGLASIHAKRENVVDDDTNATWKYLSTRSRQNRRIDIVLGNAGFGLFADIVYGAYLLQSGLASLVVFHVKDIPWYVDNPTVKDFQGTLHQLGQEDLFPTRQHLDPLLKRIQGYLSSGTMALRSHSFWTTAFGFPEMEKQAPALLRGLRASSLVIFKGDYNYRKLTAGLQWPHTTSFSEAIGALGAGSGLRILSLRANKADVCVGVKPEVIDRLDEENPNREWVRNGKYAVISFSDGADRRLWVE